jgi:hypothetical protein
MTQKPSYEAISMSKGRAKAHFKERLEGLFQFKVARHVNDVVRALLLASFNKSYIRVLQNSSIYAARP